MTPTFRRTTAACGILTASAGLTYTVTFAIVVREGSQWALWASSIALLLGAVLSLPVIIAVHASLRSPEPQFALLGLIAAVYGAYGAATHAAFDIAVLTNPVTGSIELPNQTDPRGFATFAATGLALAIFGGLILRAAAPPDQSGAMPRAGALPGSGALPQSGALPRPVGLVAVSGAVCLLVVYLGRLIALDPNTAAIKPFALLYGLIFGPAYYLLVARALRSAPSVDQLAAEPQPSPAEPLPATAGHASPEAEPSSVTAGHMSVALGSSSTAAEQASATAEPLSADVVKPASVTAGASTIEGPADETVILRERSVPLAGVPIGKRDPSGVRTAGS